MYNVGIEKISKQFGINTQTDRRIQGELRRDILYGSKWGLSIGSKWFTRWLIFTGLIRCTDRLFKHCQNTTFFQHGNILFTTFFVYVVHLTYGLHVAYGTWRLFAALLFDSYSTRVPIVCVYLYNILRTQLCLNDESCVIYY